MIEMTKCTGKSADSIRPLFFRFLLIFLICHIIAAFVAPGLWANNVYLIHSIMEIVCIFIAVSTFLIIWSSSQNSYDEYHLLGYGFLSVAVFDTFHTYFLFGTNILGQGYLHLSGKYWMMSRLCEAVILLAVAMKMKGIRVNRWIGLLMTLLSSVGISIAVLKYPGFFPDIIASEEAYPAKLFMEFCIIAMTMISLYMLRRKMVYDGTVSYQHLFMGLLFIIPAELSFTMFKELTAFMHVFGHVLKIVFYYFFYKAVFVSNVEYPYKKLNEANRILEATCRNKEEAEEILNDTLDSLPVGIMFYDNGSRIKYMNRQLEELLCCARDELLGLTQEELYKIIPSPEQAVSNGDSLNPVRTFRTMAGNNVKLHLNSQKTKNGMLVCFSEAKKEQEIKNFHIQTQTILNAVSNPIFMVDINKNITLYNEAFKRFFEIEDTDIAGMDVEQFSEIIGLEQLDIMEMRQKLTSGEGPYELSVISFKGSRREILLNMSNIKNVEDEIIGVIGAVTDITELKRNNHMVQQQEKLALIGQMAAGIVHEIKNPLATIKGLSQLIKSRSEVKKIKDYANVIDTAIDDASRVVNEFLSFAKPKPTVKMRTNVNRIVESMQLITETQCYTKNIKSRFYYSTWPMEITADETKIKQVILNLTENAIAALEGVDQPELAISTYYNSDKGEGVIQITDNGIGMSPEVLDKIGTPFFTTREKGTGLGLGMCYQIMSEHSGRMEVESIKGKGTTFKVIFTQIEDLI